MPRSPRPPRVGSIALAAAGAVAVAAAAECERFIQYNSQRPGNVNLDAVDVVIGEQGKKVEYRIAGSAQMCSDMCQQHQGHGCTCFSWNGANSRCFLMQQCETPTPRGQFVAGAAGCVVSEPAPAACRIHPATAQPHDPVVFWEIDGVATVDPGRGEKGHIMRRKTCKGGVMVEVEWKSGARGEYAVDCDGVDALAPILLAWPSCASDTRVKRWLAEAAAAPPPAVRPALRGVAAVPPAAAQKVVQPRPVAQWKPCDNNRIAMEWDLPPDPATGNDAGCRQRCHDLALKTDIDQQCADWMYTDRCCWMCSAREQGGCRARWMKQLADGVDL